MNNEEIKVMIKDCVYSEDGITYMSDKQYNNYIDIIEQLQQENKKLKEVIDKAIEYINDNLIISSILDGKKYYTINNYSFDYRELLDILKEVE